MNAPLTMAEWLVMASIAVAAVGLLVAYYGWRTRHHAPEFRTFTLHGPAVTEEMRRTFGAYGGSDIVGLIVLQDGIRVSFEGGPSIKFIPVIDGATLYVTKEGEFVVEPPAVDG